MIHTVYAVRLIRQDGAKLWATACEANPTTPLWQHRAAWDRDTADMVLEDMEHDGWKGRIVPVSRALPRHRAEARNRILDEAIAAVEQAGGYARNEFYANVIRALKQPSEPPVEIRVPR